MSYAEFLASKAVVAPMRGLTSVPALSDRLSEGRVKRQSWKNANQTQNISVLTTKRTEKSELPTVALISAPTLMQNANITPPTTQPTRNALLNRRAHTERELKISVLLHGNVNTRQTLSGSSKQQKRGKQRTLESASIKGCESTASVPTNTTRCLSRKMDVAQFVQGRILETEGADDFTLITAIPAGRLEGCFALVATWALASSETIQIELIERRSTCASISRKPQYFKQACENIRAHSLQGSLL